ncbi:MAG: hypothetical protein ACREEP_13780 [Dongiaceae bacterium]
MAYHAVRLALQVMPNTNTTPAYTVPAQLAGLTPITATIVRHIILTNNDNADHPVTVYVIDSTGSTYQVVSNTVLKKNDFLAIPLFLVLNPGEGIGAYSDVLDVMSWTASGVELT